MTHRVPYDQLSNPTELMARDAISGAIGLRSKPAACKSGEVPPLAMNDGQIFLSALAFADTVLIWIETDKPKD